jgi:hypothetical protein
MKYTGLFNLFVVIALTTFSMSSAQADVVLFDSYTPPVAFGGFSSPDSGVSIQISVTSNLTISSVAVRNGMETAGDLRFAILSQPQHQFLYLSSQKTFTADTAGELTWKQSDPLSFTFLAGNQYLVGYLHDVATDDYVDRTADSSSGVKSDLACDCLNGFSNPSYSHQCFTGVDEAVRLIGVPEPTSATLVLLGMLSCVCHRRQIANAIKKTGATQIESPRFAYRIICNG